MFNSILDLNLESKILSGHEFDRILSSCDLKTREYVTRGLPVVYCSDDLDVDPETGFFFRVPPGEEALNIEEIARWYVQGAEGGKFRFDALRNYALKNMDFKAKVHKIID